MFAGGRFKKIRTMTFQLALRLTVLSVDQSESHVLIIIAIPKNKNFARAARAAQHRRGALRRKQFLIWRSLFLDLSSRNSFFFHVCREPHLCA